LRRNIKQPACQALTAAVSAFAAPVHDKPAHDVPFAQKLRLDLKRLRE
jgi:hypothetical protein